MLFLEQRTNANHEQDVVNIYVVGMFIPLAQLTPWSLGLSPSKVNHQLKRAVS